MELRVLIVRRERREEWLKMLVVLALVAAAIGSGG
jgi:hypothetical protein